VTVSGIVDLVHETANRIEIIDYKTDQSRRAESDYRKQLSVYYHVISEWSPGRKSRQLSSTRRRTNAALSSHSPGGTRRTSSVFRRSRRRLPIFLASSPDSRIAFHERTLNSRLLD